MTKIRELKKTIITDSKGTEKSIQPSPEEIKAKMEKAAEDRQNAVTKYWKSEVKNLNPSSVRDFIVYFTDHKNKDAITVAGTFDDLTNNLLAMLRSGMLLPHEGQQLTGLIQGALHRIHLENQLKANLSKEESFKNSEEQVETVEEEVKSEAATEGSESSKSTE